MDLDPPTECKICNEDYNEDERSPKILPCFHCLCARCIDKLVYSSSKMCPFCREPFEGKSSDDFGTNTLALSLLQSIRRLDISSSPAKEKGQTSTFEDWQRNIKAETQKIIKESQLALHTIENMTDVNLRLEKDLVDLSCQINDGIMTKLKDMVARNHQFLNYTQVLNMKLLNQNTNLADISASAVESERQLETSSGFLETATALDAAELLNVKSRERLSVEKELIARHTDITQHIHKDVETMKSNLVVIKNILDSNFRSEEGQQEIFSCLESLTSSAGDATPSGASNPRVDIASQGASVAKEVSNRMSRRIAEKDVKRDEETLKRSYSAVLKHVNSQEKPECEQHVSCHPSSEYILELVSSPSHSEDLPTDELPSTTDCDPATHEVIDDNGEDWEEEGMEENVYPEYMFMNSISRGKANVIHYSKSHRLGDFSGSRKGKKNPNYSKKRFAGRRTK